MPVGYRHFSSCPAIEGEIFMSYHPSRLCPYCQNEIAEDDIFCVYCGKSLGQAPSPSYENQPYNRLSNDEQMFNDTTYPADAPVYEPAYQPGIGTARKRSPVVGILAAVLVLVGGFAFLQSGILEDLIDAAGDWGNGTVIHTNESSQEGGEETGSDALFIPKVFSQTTYSLLNESEYISVRDAELGSIATLPEFRQVRWSKITSANQHSDIGIRYENVGEYNGKMIDMALTVDVGLLLDSNTQRQALGKYISKPDTGNEYYQTPVVGFYTNAIGIAYSFPAVCNLTYECTYYYHNTHDPAPLTSQLIIKGLCGGDTITTISGIGSVSTGSHIDVSGHRYVSQERCHHGSNYVDMALRGSVTENEREHWLTMTTDAPAFSFQLSHTGVSQSGNPYQYLHDMNGSWFYIMNQFYMDGE